jgi:hypothetical protein
MKAAKRAERNGPPLSVTIVTGADLAGGRVGEQFEQGPAGESFGFGQGELDRGDRVALVGGG